MAEEEQDQESEEQEEQQETGSTLESVDDYKEALKKARGDAAKYRTRSKEYDQAKAKAEKLDKLIKELTGQDDPDPEKLKTEVESARSEARKAKLENKVIRFAVKYKADDELLLAHMDRQGLLTEENEKNLESLVKQAVEDKPTLKIQTATNTGDTGDSSDTNNKSNFNKWIRSNL